MRVLIVVDYQNDFVDGSLGFSGAERLEDLIVKKIEEYRRQQWDVIFTRDTHHEDYLQTQEGRKLPVIHCLYNSVGWEVYGQVKELMLPQDQVFDKTAFGSLALGNYLVEHQYDTVELVGLVSNICVISNAVIAKSALPNAQIIVDAGLTASSNKILHEQCLNVMEGLQIEIKR